MMDGILRVGAVIAIAASAAWSLYLWLWPGASAGEETAPTGDTADTTTDEWDW